MASNSVLEAKKAIVADLVEKIKKAMVDYGIKLA